MVFGNNSFLHCSLTHPYRGIVCFNKRKGISIFTEVIDLHDCLIVIGGLDPIGVSFLGSFLLTQDIKMEYHNKVS